MRGSENSMFASSDDIRVRSKSANEVIAVVNGRTCLHWRRGYCRTRLPAPCSTSAAKHFSLDSLRMGVMKGARCQPA